MELFFIVGKNSDIYLPKAKSQKPKAKSQIG